MKRVLAFVWIIGMVCVFAPSTSAQVPHMQIYFDNGLPGGFGREYYNDCTPGHTDYLYVVLRNANVRLVGTAFAVDYPAGKILWLADIPHPDAVSVFGSTPVAGPYGGISIAWPEDGAPNGWEPVLVCTVLFQCLLDCADMPDTPIQVVPHYYVGVGPLFYEICFGCYPIEHEAIGMTSWFCTVTVPTEQSSWGSIKALYE